jgi:glucose/mannose transport system permease protein
MVFALKVFDFIYVLTGGGPGYSTYVLPLLMFRNTFSMNQYAYGAAIATLLFLLALVIVVPYMYLSSRREKD